MVSAAGLTVLTAVGMSCWCQVGTDPHFQGGTAGRWDFCRTSAALSVAAFQVFAGITAAQPLHDGSSSVSGQTTTELARLG